MAAPLLLLRAAQTGCGLSRLAPLEAAAAGVAALAAGGDALARAAGAQEIPAATARRTSATSSAPHPSALASSGSLAACAYHTAHCSKGLQHLFADSTSFATGKSDGLANRAADQLVHSVCMAQLRSRCPGHLKEYLPA